MDLSNWPQKPLNRQQSLVKFNKRNKQIETILWLLFLSKIIVNLILQCTYLTLQALIEQTKEERAIKLKTTIKWVEDLMVNIGQIHRADGTTGIFFYSICFSSVIVYNLLKLMSGDKSFDLLSKTEVIFFLARPHEDSRMVPKRIYHCIDFMIYSNKNFTKKIIDSLKRKGSDSGSSSDSGESDSKLENIIERYSIFKRNKTIPISHVDCTNRSIHIPLDRLADNLFEKFESKNTYILGDLKNEKSENDFKVLNAGVELIEAMYRQHQYLVKLKSNINKVWPPSRNIHMFRLLKRIGSLIYITYGISAWFSGQLITILAIHLAYSSLQTSSFDPDGRRFNLLDRLQCIEYHIYTYFVMFSYIPDFCVYLVTTIYQLQQLRNLWSQTDRFYEGVKRCEIWQQNYNNNQFSKRGNFTLNEQIKKDLKFECDKNMIELYISYYVFRQEVLSAVKTSETAANQIVACIALAMLPILPYFEHIPTSHWSSLMAVFLVLIIIFNTPFILCAFFNSACNSFAKNAWSLLAFVEGHNHRLYLTSNCASSWSALSKRNINEDDTNGENYYHNRIHSRKRVKRTLDYVYYSKSFITPHSMILWHGLIKGHHVVSKGFVVKLFGTFELNYSGVLKFNHWLVWVSLLTLVYQ